MVDHDLKAQLENRIAELEKQVEKYQYIAGKYQALFNSFPLGITVSDKEGNVVETNAAAEKLLGVSKKEHEQRSINDEKWRIVRSDGSDMPPHEWPSMIALKGKKLVSDCEMGVEKAGGDMIWLNVTASPIRLQSGGVIITYSDITQRKLTERDLWLHEAIVSSALEPMAVIDKNYTYRFVNNSYESFWGIRKQDIIGRRVPDILGSEVFEKTVKDKVERCFKGEVINYGAWFESPLKGSRFMNLNYYPYRNQNGDISGLINVAYDITERKKAENSLQESERKWRNILVNVPQIGIALDTKASIVFANEYFLNLTGWSEQEVIGQNWFEMFIPDSVREEVRHVFKSVMTQEDTLGFSTYENEIISRSGERLNIAWSNVLTKDQEGRIADVTCLGVDLTERKRIEQRLRENESKYKTILKSAMDGFWLTDTKGRILEVNDAYCHMSGYSADALLAMKVEDLDVLEDPLEVGRRIGSIIEKGEDRFVSRHRRKDGEVFDVEISIQFCAEPVERCICFIRDISRQVKAFETIRKANEKMRLAADSARLGVWSLDVRENRLEWDDWMFRLYGMERKNFDGAFEAWQAGVHPDDIERAGREVEQALKGEKEFNTEFRIIRPDGEIRHIKASAAVSLDDQGRPVSMTGINYDITERKLAEQAVEESEKRYRLTFEAIPDSITVTRFRDGRYQYVNDGFCNITGYSREEVIGKTPFDISLYVNEQDRERMTRILKRDKVLHNFEIPFRRKDGTVFDSFFSARPVVIDNENHLIALAKDVTEMKQAEKEKLDLESQLHQSRKLESIGRLAGGVAHDFNNMLNVILGNTELVMDDLGPYHSGRSNLNEIKKAAQRSSHLTRQLLAFARKQIISPKIIDLNHTIENMLKMLSRLIGEDIDLAWHPSETPALVKIDPTQVDQMMANLCINARDSIKGVGQVAIETHYICSDKNISGQENQEYVQIKVSDNGCGMSREVLENIFEPFYTTKEFGQGTGLGLATVHGIVKQNDGFINVTSEPGKGTSFAICLPGYKEEPASDTQTAAVEKLSKGHETILLVEDEKAILEMAALMLKRLGYKVIAAGSPQEAIRMSSRCESQIDLLMTDVIMPEMNGPDLAETILKTFPKMKCLFMSGYTDDVIARSGLLDQDLNFISKPFLKNELAAKLRDILDKKEA